MPLPFRTPQSADGDPPEQEWSPPDYFKPSEDSGEEWIPPDYFKASSEEVVKKPSVFKRADRIDPKTDIIHRGLDAASKFLDEHPKIREIGRNLLEVPHDKNYPLVGQELAKIPQAEKIGEYIKNKGINTGNYWGGFAGSVLGDLVNAPLDPRAMAVKDVPGIEPSIRQPAAAEELPIRRNVRTDLTKRPIKDTTPQQDAVAIAQTRDSIPRTAKNISDETGIPQPSVRRTMSELEKKSTTDQERLSISKKIFADEVPVKQADKLAKDPYEFAGESIRQPEAVHRDFGYGEIPPEGSIPPTDIPPQAASIEQPPIKQEAKPPVSWNPFDKRNSTITPEQSIAEDKPLPTRSPNLDPNRFDIGTEAPKPQFKSTEDQLYEIARNKHKMGQDLPNGIRPSEESQIKQPTAKFMYDWPEVGKQYDIDDPSGVTGGLHKSTVGEDTLKRLGIDIPEATEEAQTESLKAKADAEARWKETKSSVDKEWKPPEYFKPVEEEKPFQSGQFSKYEEGQKFANEISPKTSEETTKIDESQPQTDITELHGGLGGIKPSSRVLEPNSGPYGRALDSLFQSMGNIKEARVSQDIINKTERAKRFAKFTSVKEEGVIGAAKSLSAMKGEFEKVDLDKLKMTQPQVDSLFTAVKRAKITEGEKLRGYTALFKLFNGEGVPQRNELAILDQVFGNGFADKITEMHGGIGAVGLKISKLANTMKSMENAMSLAAPLRHGAGLMTHKEFYPAFRDMFKFFANKEFYNTSMQAIEENPNYMKFREAGGFISKPNSLMNSEEEFLNSYVGNLPKASGIPQIVGASQRAYMGFLNKLRFDVANSMYKKAESLGNTMFTEIKNKSGEITYVPSKEATAIAKFINNATGRGDLGSLNKMTNELNLLLWSPRMISSRINMFANPKIYMDLPKGMRREGLKTLLGVASMSTIVNTLGYLGGAKIGTNILSTDFMKSRFPGNKVVDPNAGLQQFVVAAARFLQGKTDSATPTSRLEIAGRFAANKESPAASLAHVLLTAKKFTGQSDDPATAGNFTTQYGQKSSIQSEIGKRFLPIFVQDIQDLMSTEPDWSKDIGLDVAMGAASLAGMSQSYPEPKPKGLLRPMRRLAPMR
jgi:hypothetical protein